MINTIIIQCGDLNVPIPVPKHDNTIMWKKRATILPLNCDNSRNGIHITENFILNLNEAFLL